MIPTPDPSLIPAMVNAVTPIFTDNATVLIGAVVGLFALITLPLLIAKGTLAWAAKGVKKLFHRV